MAALQKEEVEELHLGDIRGSCAYSNVAERGGRGVASGLRLKGRLCSMLRQGSG